MNDTELIDDLRAQMEAWTSSDEPDLAALLAPQRRRPSRTLWAAGGVTMTAGAAAAAVLLAQAGAPAPSATPPARAGAAPSSLDASIKAAIRTGPESMPVFSPQQTLPVPTAPDDSAELAAAQWFTVKTVSSGMYVTSPQRQVWFSHHGDTMLKQAHAPTSLGTKPIGAGSLEMTWDQMQALPRDPAKLASLVTSSGGDSPDYQRFDGARTLLEESPADLSLRVALVRVLVADKAVVLTTGTADSRGRSSFELRIAAPGGTNMLDIDPSNYRVLEETDTFAASSHEEGPVVSGVPHMHVVQDPAGSSRAIFSGWGYDAPPAG